MQTLMHSHKDEAVTAERAQEKRVPELSSGSICTLPCGNESADYADCRPVRQFALCILQSDI
jgi:hypothetical protein